MAWCWFCVFVVCCAALLVPLFLLGLIHYDLLPIIGCWLLHVFLLFIGIMRCLEIFFFS